MQLIQIENRAARSFRIFVLDLLTITKDLYRYGFEVLQKLRPLLIGAVWVHIHSVTGWHS